MREINDTPTKIKIWASELEASAEEQIRNVSKLPFIHNHVAVMPDAHAGKGSTIGTVIATKGAVIPSCVGVDLGCGMSAVKLPYTLDQLHNLKELRHSIERSVPTGRNGNREVSGRVETAFAEMGLPPSMTIENELVKRAMLQLGSLGGGNHFIEVCTDLEGGTWVMLHSGSRNIGKELAERHINKAKGVCKQRMLELPDPDLAYFTEDMPEFQAYIKDMLWAQNFAKFNRNEMMLRVIKDISYHVHKDARLTQENLFRVDCHHNYCEIEHHFGADIWVTRKGAVSARVGEFGIVPGSMGTKSFIVKGKGNPESFHSCSHGAGRRMSRTQARKMYTEEDLIAQTIGVECPKSRAFIDEIPSAYKNIDTVMADQADLVDVVYQIKQVLCVKGD